LWAIAGLGNFPAKYRGTRHNVGFMVAEELAARHSLKFVERQLYRVARGSVGGYEVVIAEPLTYMNRSGEAVYKLIQRFGVVPENLIVVHDDIDMPAGRLKVRLGGSSGGHRGIDSVIERIATRDFIRVKIGIGRDPDISPEQYVLRKFARDEQLVIEEAIADAADAVECILSEGLESAMNRFNTKKA
jgi:PTH1 family peptidyl-tRNA hydrolase